MRVVWVTLGVIAAVIGLTATIAGKVFLDSVPGDRDKGQDPHKLYWRDMELWGQDRD